MSYNENFLFFNEGTDAANATGDGALYKSSSFLGCDVNGSATARIYFKAIAGDAADDYVTVVQGTSNIKRLYQEVASALSNPKGGMLVQSDFAGNNAPKRDGFISDASIAITLDL